MGIRLSAPAQDDIIAILAWSGRSFGDVARLRYEQLLAAALRDIESDPRHVGSASRPELGDGARTWHLRLSRDSPTLTAGRVASPRHLLVYREEPQGIGVARVLHDAMELAARVPSAGPWP